MVDMNARVAGSVEKDGKLQLGTDHDALEEIVRHAQLTGARVLSLRSADMPNQLQAAAILRYAV